MNLKGKLAAIMLSNLFIYFFLRMTVLEKEDWRSVIGLVTNAKQVVTPVQDVGSKVAGYAKC